MELRNSQSEMRNVREAWYTCPRMTARHHEPVYRPILREAFELSWKEKRLWLVSAVAGILLTGSIYDVIVRGMNAVTPRGSLFTTIALFWKRFIETWPTLTPSDLIFGSLNVLIVTATLLIICFAIFACSVIAQGTLVYAIGARRRGRVPAFRDALTVGARALWPVLVLNILALLILFATRAFTTVVITTLLNELTSVMYLLYLISFIIFVVIGMVTVIIEVFALNAMILQGATLAQAIERGFHMFRKHWVIAMETAIILFIISVGATVLLIAIGMILTVPFFIMSLTAVAVKSLTLFNVILYAFLLLYFAVIVVIFGYTVQLHYTTWTLLFRKLGEGGVLPKLHRIARQFIHSTKIPGS